MHRELDSDANGASLDAVLAKDVCRVNSKSDYANKNCFTAVVELIEGSAFDEVLPKPSEEQL
jgi:hypothetical protein